MSTEQIRSGRCFCGRVQFEVTGQPVAMGYCHCESCRHWSAGPVNAFTLWKPDALRLTRGAADLATFNKSPNSHRRWCKTCGGHVLTEHPSLGLIDIYAPMLPGFAFEPGVHVHYQETVLRIRDGKPKMRDMPVPMGVSGVELPE